MSLSHVYLLFSLCFGLSVGACILTQPTTRCIEASLTPTAGAGIFVDTIPAIATSLEPLGWEITAPNANNQISVETGADPEQYYIGPFNGDGTTTITQTFQCSKESLVNIAATVYECGDLEPDDTFTIRLTSFSGGLNEATSVDDIGASEGQPDPTCEAGEIGSNGGTGICCLDSCDACGGAGCDQLPGGEDGCCTSNILDSGVSCDDGPAPCIISDGAEPVDFVEPAEILENQSPTCPEGKVWRALDLDFTSSGVALMVAADEAFDVEFEIELSSDSEWAAVGDVQVRCTALDEDMDGVANTDDECPEEAGTVANDGCPEDAADPAEGDGEGEGEGEGDAGDADEADADEADGDNDFDSAFEALLRQLARGSIDGDDDGDD